VNEYGRHFEIYITLDETDRFSAGSIESGFNDADACEAFLQRGEFDPSWNLSYVQSFKSSTRNDLKRLNEIHDIPLDHIEGLLDKEIRILYPDISFIRPVYDKDKLIPHIKPYYGQEIRPEHVIRDRLLDANPKTYCIIVFKNKDQVDRRQEFYLDYYNRVDVGVYQLFIPKPESIPQDIPKYRLYLNDRLLTERIYETSLEHDRRCYAESIWIKNEPEKGFNFTLATDLNITIAAVDIDGVRHRVNAKTFTYTPDK
jgi:hypothetical protein